MNVSSYNYLGFAQAQGGCADAVEEGIKRYGISSLASRGAGGTTDLHLQAESLVARFVGKEDAIIVSMGFATNSSALPALVGKGALVISDEHNHASIRFGLRLSGAVIRTYKHNSIKDLERVLRESISQGQPRTHRPWKKVLLVVEGLYSMEGSLVDLPAVIELKKRYKVSSNHGYSLTDIVTYSSFSSIYMWTRRIRLVRWVPKAVVSPTISMSVLKILTF
jgi:serine palmitoyltransferase